MHSAHHLETAELSETELDNVSGGLAPHVGVVAGPTAISDSDLLAQAGAVQGQVLGTLGEYHQVGASASF
ncbi:class IIb bacteriocin, lactobin A/cerein 7B family [Streptomyces sp. NPDC087437]|uniref:class IIb bacteriocin, lactobin A/cerein 7B family n=1 Tax=Streptomyces sp. NPDC087437 TaxID=3365789 RepID=UPI00381DCC69